MLCARQKGNEGERRAEFLELVRDCFVPNMSSGLVAPAKKEILNQETATLGYVLCLQPRKVHEPRSKGDPGCQVTASP